MFRGPIVTFGLFLVNATPCQALEVRMGQMRTIESIARSPSGGCARGSGRPSLRVLQKDQDDLAKVDITGVSGEITKEGVDIDKPKN